MVEYRCTNGDSIRGAGWKTLNLRVNYKPRVLWFLENEFKISNRIYTEWDLPFLYAMDKEYMWGKLGND